MSKRSSFWLLISLSFLSLLLSVTILFLFDSMPPKLPLFYSLPWGEEQLAERKQFLIIPSSIILITLLNFTISSGLHSSQNFFKKFLFSASIVCSLILTIAFLKIILMF